MTCYPIKVLIVENSPLAAKLLELIIHSDPNLKVIGCVNTGEKALEFIKIEKPDVITMDIILPNMDGFETTQKIMQTLPIPIIIVSANFQRTDIEKSFKAISVGALEILEKPVGPCDSIFQTRADALITSIRNAGKIKLLTRSYYTRPPPNLKEKINLSQLLPVTYIEAIAIGTSMGGPQALKTILSQLPLTFPIPLLIVQHISTGFTQGLVDWLQQNSALKIKLAQHHEITKPGCVYIAPDQFHLEVGHYHILHLNKDPPEKGLRPSVAHLFRSMATIYGSHGIGILLTGMGHDGAKELFLMKEKGALTLAQDQESSLIFGMSKEALAIGAVKHMLSLQQIVDFLKLIKQ